MAAEQSAQKTQKILSHWQLSSSHEVSLDKEELFRHQCDQYADGRKACNL